MPTSGPVTEMNRRIVEALLLLVILAGSVQAQTDEEVSTAPRLTVTSGSVPLYTSDRWGSVGLTLANPSDQPVEVEVATHFDDRATLQFGRRLWLPADSLLRTLQPLHHPTLSTTDKSLVEVWSQLRLAGSDTVIKDRNGKFLSDYPLRQKKKGAVTGVVNRLGDPGISFPGQVSVSDLVETTRLERNLLFNTVFLTNPALPASAAELDVLDQLVLGDDRLMTDAAALSALRNWLTAGGHLWVLLDRVDPQLMENLLGDDWTTGVVDRVDLTSFEIVTGPLGGPDVRWQASHDHAVSFVRVFTSGTEVAYSIDGWPAAFWQRCGQGQILVTTLAADGWLSPRTPRDPPPAAGHGRQTRYLPIPALNVLAQRFYELPTASTMPEVMQEHVREYVGYSIPSRTVVLGVLGAFTAILIGFGAVFARRQQLERLGWFGPLAAATSAGVLILLGMNHQDAVPVTNALLQQVEPVVGTHDVRLTGQIAMYSNGAGDAQPAGTHPGWLMPEMSGQEGQTRRLVWTDSERWHWQNLPQTPGLRTASFEMSARVVQPVAATATLDERGLIGRMTLPDSVTPTDGIVVTPFGRLGLQFADGGQFAASADQILATDQYLAAGLLSDEQQRRSRTLAALLAQRSKSEMELPPALYFWSAPWPAGLNLPSESQTSGSALINVPMTLAPPPPGTSIRIPAPLIGYREARGPDGALPTGLYDFRRRSWTEKNRPGTSWLRFQIPESLLPVEVQSAKLRIQVSGPMGLLRIAGFKDGRVVPLHAWKDPIGLLEYTLTEIDTLAMTADGKLFLKIFAGDPDRPELTAISSDGSSTQSYWRIESLSFEVTGRTAEAHPAAAP